MKRLVSVILVILCLVMSLPVYATEDEALDISIVNNVCSGLNDGSSYDSENRVLTLAEGKYGSITCNNDLTIKTTGKTIIFQIKAEKEHGSSILKIIDANINPNPNKVGSNIVCNGDIEIKNSLIELDYFIVTETGSISIENSTVTLPGITKMQGYIFANGNIYIRKSIVTADYNINTYGSMVIENSTVKLPSKYSNGGYITAPSGILIKNSTLDLNYYVFCDSGDFRAVKSNIHISLNRDDNKRRSNIEVGIGNITIADSIIDVDAFIKTNIGSIDLSNSKINTGSLVAWNGSVTLNRVEGSINGAKSINSDSATGIFCKSIELINTNLPDGHLVGNAVIGEDKYATITYKDGEMAYGFKLFAKSAFPIVWIIVIGSVVVLAAVVAIIIIFKKKKKAQ